MSKIKLVECIGSTWQGEGPDAGRKMSLVRFQKCSRIEEGRMCYFCDTAVKLRINCEAEYDIDTIQKSVAKSGGLMITGGEPTFSSNLDDTLTLLNECDFEICNIESNGYNIKRLLADLPISKLDRIKVMYSPKFFDLRELQNELQKINDVISNQNVYLKFVDDGTGMLIDCLREVRLMKPRGNQLWIMPQGKTCRELIENSPNTIDICDEYEANFSSRNHIIYNFI